MQVHPLIVRAISIVAVLVHVVACDSDDSDGWSHANELPLPGDHFHPEGLAIDSSGTLYVGSVGTGEVLKFEASSQTPTRVIAPGTGGLMAAVGVAVDEPANKLWVCAADITFSHPNALMSFDLATGAADDNISLPGGAGICNDLVRDPAGNLYITDSILGRILRLPTHGDALEVWSADPAFAGGPMEFTVNGADYDAATHTMYVVKSSSGQVLRVPVASDGSAQSASVVALDRPLMAPDGLRVVDSSTLVVVETQTGSLTRVSLGGSVASTTVLATGFEAPTGVAVDAEHAWVAEGQVLRLIGQDPSPAKLPFLLRRVDM